MREYANQFLSEENSDKKIFSGLTKAASKRLSKLRKRISTLSSSRDSGIGFPGTETFLTKGDERTNINKIRLTVKRFTGIGKERRHHCEAYHQDGKTNPFE